MDERQLRLLASEAQGDHFSEWHTLHPCHIESTLQEDPVLSSVVEGSWIRAAEDWNDSHRRSLPLSLPRGHNSRSVPSQGENKPPSRPASRLHTRSIQPLKGPVLALPPPAHSGQVFVTPQSQGPCLRLLFVPTLLATVSYKQSLNEH